MMWIDVVTEVDVSSVRHNAAFSDAQRNSFKSSPNRDSLQMEHHYNDDAKRLRYKVPAKKRKVFLPVFKIQQKRDDSKSA